ncbi:nucleotidyltransferase family protein [Pseudomonas leptonychotis]|uniref:Nucleotidyltransferase family protein n=1 Tax=Pseudomonas leptonychotis TaxID=2448482 RepID=A0A4T1ZZ51_9PSED|nr:nucleotidyltransferase family protein [Pseudomonas leptonychotis]TIH09893.1 nucleotidyltransferase family protein [Pseudomonas leptonychotis]
MPKVIALMLAAGRGSRFGSDKRVALMVDGRSLLAASVERAQQVFSQVHVLLRAEDDPQTLGLAADCQVIRCAEADQGMGHSLAAGIRGLAGQDAEAIAVMLGDMPWVSAHSLQQLCDQATPERIVYPLCEGRRGHPVLFGRAFWPQLLNLTGDQGARELLQAHAAVCHPIVLDDAGVLRDVDRPEALLAR